MGSSLELWLVNQGSAIKDAVRSGHDVLSSCWKCAEDDVEGRVSSSDGEGVHFFFNEILVFKPLICAYKVFIDCTLHSPMYGIYSYIYSTPKKPTAWCMLHQQTTCKILPWEYCSGNSSLFPPPLLCSDCSPSTRPRRCRACDWLM